MIVLYGGSPPNDDGGTGRPFVWPPTPVTNLPPLVPCPSCQRHIYFGSMCPFCFAEQIAKAPSRAALEAVKKGLEEALRLVNEALK